MEERRSKTRFPVNLPVKFTGISGSMRILGTGTVVDISSRGFSFRADTPLQHGMVVTASLAWPVALNEDCRLRLSIEGHVVRVDGALVVMTINRYEFRTSGRVDKPSLANIAALTQQLAELSPQSSTLESQN